MLNYLFYVLQIIWPNTVNQIESRRVIKNMLNMSSNFLGQIVLYKQAVFRFFYYCITIKKTQLIIIFKIIKDKLICYSKYPAKVVIKIWVLMHFPVSASLGNPVYYVLKMMLSIKCTVHVTNFRKFIDELVSQKNKKYQYKIYLNNESCIE